MRCIARLCSSSELVPLLKCQAQFGLITELYLTPLRGSPSIKAIAESTKLGRGREAVLSGLCRSILRSIVSLPTSQEAFSLSAQDFRSRPLLRRVTLRKYRRRSEGSCESAMVDQSDPLYALR